MTVRGAKEIIVIDEIKFSSAEEFFEDLARGHPPGEVAVNWANGVVFIHLSFPWNEITVREYIEHGRIYWSSIKYAPMEKYEDKVIKDHVIFHIRKVRTPILVKIAEELRKKLAQGEHDEVLRRLHGH